MRDMVDVSVDCGRMTRLQVAALETEPQSLASDDHKATRWGRMVRLIIGVALVLAIDFSAKAFTSGSTGSDGALNITVAANGSDFEFNPAAFVPPLDPDGDGIYNFTTINVGAGVTVHLTAKYFNGPTFWLAQGAVTIGGVLKLDGADGVDGTNELNGASRRPPIPGPNGFSGGVGGTSINQIGKAGHGPGGAPPPQSVYAGGGGGHASVGGRPSGGCGNEVGASYGNPFLFPLVGGSGGAGGPFTSTRTGGTGGAGGGAILIASSSSIAVNGTIQANGGRGGANTTAGFGGGGGSGGSIHLLAPTVTGAGTLSAAGGVGGAVPAGCQDGGNGSVGRIRVEAVQRLWTLTMNPLPTVATPIVVHLPATPVATVRAVSITDGSGTHPVAAIPSGDFAAPDVTINAAGAVTVEIQAKYVPLGTVVKLDVLSETGADQTVNSTPLSGADISSSTATVTVSLPAGWSRGYLSTTWTP